jgi:hypothetical protein
LTDLTGARVRLLPPKPEDYPGEELPEMPPKDTATVIQDDGDTVILELDEPWEDATDAFTEVPKDMVEVLGS